MKNVKTKQKIKKKETKDFFFKKTKNEQMQRNVNMKRGSKTKKQRTNDKVKENEKWEKKKHETIKQEKG